LVAALIFSLSQVSFAQDTESKDVRVIITIYIQLQSKSIDCNDCEKDLENILKQVKGARNIQVSFLEECADFEIYSSDFISKKDLEMRLKKAGFFSESIEIEKDPILNRPLRQADEFQP